MSFCPIDEAFGNYMTNDLTPDPLESTSYRDKDSGDCSKRQKIKKNKINCNRRSTSFTMNPEDIYNSPPDISDSDADFNSNLQGYSSMDDIELYSIKAKNPASIRKKCRKKKTPKHTEILNTMSDDYSYERYTRPCNKDQIETFANYNPTERVSNRNISHNKHKNNGSSNKKIKIKKTNKDRQKRPEVNEIYEYNDEDNIPMDEINHENIEYVHTSDSELEETRPIFLHQDNNRKKNRKGMDHSNNSQINEINNKINFIMNQISNNNQEDESKEYNNLNDIILFVIFGVFVIIIIEALYRLITKIIKANSIIGASNNSIIGKNNNSRSKIMSNDPIEMVTNYIKNKN